MRIGDIYLFPVVDIGYIVAYRYFGKVKDMLIALEVVVCYFILDNKSFIHFL